MTKRSIIIDTDPGIDDAIALAFALHHPEIDVKLITTVAGNVGLDYTTENALKLLSFFGKDIPLAQGFSAALIRKQADASHIHGKTGMEGYDFGQYSSKNLLSQHAVEVMRQYLEKSEDKTTLVCIGPLTNVAILIRMYPQVLPKIEEIILMGGSSQRGNAGVLSEFNINFDPEAAKIVFSSGLKLTMLGLDVGWKALVMPEDIAIIKDMNKTGQMMTALFSRYRSGSIKTGLRMYDSTAIAYLVNPEIYQCQDAYVAIETNGQYTSGATVVDLKGYLKQEPNVKVALEIKTAEFRKWFMANMKNCI